MSFVSISPEFVTTAAGDLARLGSALSPANTAAAVPTTELLAAANDVSTQITVLFGGYARDDLAISARLGAFQ